MGAPTTMTALADLGQAFSGRPVQVLDDEQLKPNVHRVRVVVDGTERLLVAKWSDPTVARRCSLVARRWLPAAGLQDLGPRLLCVAPDWTQDGAWHIYEHQPGRPLSSRQVVPDEVEAAVEALARVHTAFAEHRLLPEFRLWGGDRGSAFFSANVRDAVRALQSLDAGPLDPDVSAARAAVLRRMRALQEEEPERAAALAAAGGPETLVHGDLWPTNVIVLRENGSLRIRLIDWDEAAAGGLGSDLSTFLVRFDRSHRRWILDAYRRAADRLAGWTLPSDRDLNAIFETAAYARLASFLVWSIAELRDEPRHLNEHLAGMVGWLDTVSPVLPDP